MKQIAQALASHGRGPDTELLHVTKGELAALAAMGGLKSLPKNPETGLHEAGLLSLILPLAASYFLGPEMMTMMGGNAMLAGAATGAISGGLGSMMNGQGLSGALTGGLTGGAMGQMGLMAKGDTPGLAPGSNLAGQGAQAGSNAAATGETLARGAATPNAFYTNPTADLVPAGGYPGDTASQVANMQAAGSSALPQAAYPAGTPAPAGYTMDRAATVGNNISSTNFPELPPARTPLSLADAYGQTPAVDSAGRVIPDAARIQQANAAIKASQPGFMSSAADFAALNPKTTAALAGAGIYGLNQMMKPRTIAPINKDRMLAGKSESGITQTGAPIQYGGAGENQYFANNTPSNYTTAPSYLSHYADGGQVNSGDLFNAPLMPDHQRQQLDPSIQHMTQGGTPSYAEGGILNLRPHAKHMNPTFLQGEGDGMSDSIPAHIDGEGKRPNEPIRVANEEYIVPADIVSGLGNGSSDAGAKHLDKVMAKVRKARTGKTTQAKQINPNQFLPA